MPQSEVNDIIQDKYGFIWIATLDGLYRYDGYEYKAYLSDGQEGAISTNMILSLDIDSYNNLWLVLMDADCHVLTTKQVNL